MHYTAGPVYSIPNTGKKSKITSDKAIREMPAEDYSSPGPMYNTAQLNKQVSIVSHRLGTSQRTKINHGVGQTPAPDTYNPPKPLPGKSMSIPKAAPEPRPNKNPDAGCYNPEDKRTKKRAAQYSLGGRYCSIMDQINKNPGPGQYENSRPITALQKSKSVKSNMFSSSRRFRAADASPGVGEYEIRPATSQTKWTVGTGAREPVTKDNVPGPCDYRKQSCFDENFDRKIGKSMSQKLTGCFKDNQLTTNSFGKYYTDGNPPSPQYHSTQRFSFSKSPRKVFEGKKGPCTHDYRPFDYQGKHNTRAVIPKSKYIPRNDTEPFPGPGTYTHSPSHHPEYSIGRAKSAAIIGKVSYNPGVGRYDLEQNGTKRGGNTFGRSSRTNFISKNMAGVGDYDLLKAKGAACTMGKANRFGKTKASPGPGDYNVSSIVGWKSRHRA